MCSHWQKFIIMSAFSRQLIYVRVMTAVPMCPIIFKTFYDFASNQVPKIVIHCFAVVLHTTCKKMLC